MKRLLYVIHHSVFGGPHNHALRLFIPLSKRGWELAVLLPDEPGNAAGRLRQAGVPIIQIPLHRLRASKDPRLALSTAISFPREVQAIRRIVRERSVDLVSVAGLVNPHAAIAARLERTAVLWKIIDSRTPPALRWFMMHAVRRLADAVMFTGERLIVSHSKHGNLGLPSFVYYPPVDTRTFRPSAQRRAEVRAQLGVPPEALVVGTVANLNPQKGLEYFIQAAAIIKRALPQTWFLVVGGRHSTHEPYANRLMKDLASSGLSPGRLIWVGAQTDVERFYPAMDVKVISSVSLSEGVPTTAIEAISCGVPVVTTNVGAVSEVIIDGVNGFVVVPEDARALAEAILKLLQDPPLRDKFGKEGRQRAVDRYDVEVSAASQVAAFDAILDRRDKVSPVSRRLSASYRDEGSERRS